MAEKDSFDPNRDSSLKEWNKSYAELEKDYEEAYLTVAKAIKMDEDGKINEALPLYEQSLNMINKALDIEVDEPTKPNFTWEKTLVMTQKLKKTRKEIIIRIDTIKKQPEPTSTDFPPSYEEAVTEAGLMAKPDGKSNNGNNFHLPGTHKTEVPYISPSMVHDPLLLANLQIKEAENHNAQNSGLSQQMNDMMIGKREEILFHCNNVLLHFIAPDGRVSSTSETNTLVIARLYDDTSRLLDEVLLKVVSDISRDSVETKKKKHRKPHLHRKRYHEKGKKHSPSKEGKNDSTAFLQVGSWIYPLIPDVSPCIRSEYGAFIFPDITSGVEGAAVGIIVPDEVLEPFQEILNSILNEVSEGKRSRRSTGKECPLSEDYTSKIVKGSSYIANNLIWGAGTTAKFMDSSAPKIIERINPQLQPKEFSPRVQQIVHAAKTVSGKAVNVTDYLATKVSDATSALGRYLSPYIQKQGSRLLVSTTNMNEEEAHEKFNSALDTASNTLEGLSIVYGGLETAISILAKSLSNNTVQIIEHKYGQTAGALTSDALKTIGNVYYAQHNFKVLKPKGFTKAAISGVGNAILKNYNNPKLKAKPHEEFQGSGPGSGSGFQSQ